MCPVYYHANDKRRTIGNSSGGLSVGGKSINNFRYADFAELTTKIKQIQKKTKR